MQLLAPGALTSFFFWSQVTTPMQVRSTPARSRRHFRSSAILARHSGVWRFFVPAASTEEGAFEARIPRYEGFWRSSSRADENLPWPQPEAKWPERAAFLKLLDRAEAEAQRVSYRGFSHCRICGCRNGSQSFRLDVWEWPSGFRHYVTDHEVRPSPEFELFVREWAQRAARLTV